MVIDMVKSIAVVGAGASGMMAAVWAARAGAKVTVYERNNRVGKKILATGNGKCNFSNEKMGSAWYFGSGKAMIDDIYQSFGLKETMRFYEELGSFLKGPEKEKTWNDVFRRDAKRI